MNVLFTLYLTNVVLLIVHEMDSAYWREWNLFKGTHPEPGKDERRDLTAFLLFHVPVLYLFLYGLVAVARQTTAGLVLSLVVAICGLAAFGIHMFFFRRGRTEFRIPISIAVLAATLVVSVAQLVVTTQALVADRSTVMVAGW